MLDSIKNKFQFKFKDRTSAANVLAAALMDTINKQRLRNNNNAITVLGIPRGGVVLADVIATKLKASYFDIIIPRKLRIPHNEEAAFGAIMGDGTVYVDDRIVRDLVIPEDYIEHEKKLQMREIERRSTLYTQGKPRQQGSENKIKCTTTGIITTTILVDDGAASGATIIAAARSVRKTSSSNSKLIIALPVAPKDTVNGLLMKEADHVEVIVKPSFFNSVGQYYQNFEPVDDEKVIDIIKNRMT